MSEDRAEPPRPDDASAATPSPQAADATAAVGAEFSAIPAAVELPSPDVALADEASPLPGAHRGGFQRLPTAPVALTVESAPTEPGISDGGPPVAEWLIPPSAPPRRGLANWALVFSILGLLVALFVGWGFPIGLVGVISAILAFRRPLENRAVAVWALVLGIVSVLYSAGWLLYAAGRADLFG
ncbi:hypothetical protein [Microbacterium deminutum]|uniref:DUF4190 domain-containing protein n=1 Tax=Microbacterium deminutum TaxID=344164 RepID=A0ABN2Q4Y2_9MICO